MTKNNQHIVNVPHDEKAEPIHETQAQRHIRALESAFLSCYMSPVEYENFLKAYRNEFKKISENTVLKQERRDVLNDFEDRQALRTQVARSADSELQKTQTFAPKRPTQPREGEAVMTFAPAFSLFDESPHTQSSSSSQTSSAVSTSANSSNSVPHSSINSVIQNARNILRKRLHSSFAENVENVSPNTVTIEDNTSDLTTASENSSVASDSDMPQTKRYKR
jgi:hypothetical protein